LQQSLLPPNSFGAQGQWESKGCLWVVCQG
jgi:hypothetical protein